MDQQPRAHHVLLQTGHCQVWSLGPANTRGAVCAQGRDRKYISEISVKQFTPCRSGSVLVVFLFPALKTRPQMAPKAPFLPFTTSAASYRLPRANFPLPRLQHINYISLISQNNFPPALHSIGPPGEPSPRGTRTHRQGRYSHGNTANDSYKAHTSRGEGQHLEHKIVLKHLTSSRVNAQWFTSSPHELPPPLFIILTLWSYASFWLPLPPSLCASAQVIRDVLLLGHRQAFAWVDEWIGEFVGERGTLIHLKIKSETVSGIKFTVSPQSVVKLKWSLSAFFSCGHQKVISLHVS